MRFCSVMSKRHRTQLIALLVISELLVIMRGRFVQPHLPSEQTRSVVAVATSVDVAETQPLPTSFCDDRILTVAHDGKLGNLMFQVASAYGIALHNRMTLTLSSFDQRTSVLRSIFDELRAIPDSPGRESLHHVKFHRWGAFDPAAFNLSIQQCVLLDGYLQSYKYFEGYEEHVRRMLRFNEVTTKDATQVVKTLTAGRGNSTTVGVHVRRGDLLTERLREFGFVVPDADYFRRAMQYFRSKYVDVLFVVISEDIEWCKSNINGTDVVFGSANYPQTHMCALSMLDHLILSVGTFGWWAGYLNRGEKVYFRNVARSGTGYAYGFSPDDLFPKEWIPR